MRYRIIAGLVLIGASGLVGGLYLRGRLAATERALPALRDSTGLPPGPTTPQPPVPTPSPTIHERGLPLRSMDREIFERIKQGVSGLEAKDAVPNPKYQVNLYRDAGPKPVSRVTIDWGRDGTLDETWTFADDGTVQRTERQVDDEGPFELTYTLAGDRWQ